MKTAIIMIENDVHRKFLIDVLTTNNYTVAFETNDMLNGIEKCKELKANLIMLDRDNCVEEEIYNQNTIKTIRTFDNEVIIVQVSIHSPRTGWIMEVKKAGANGIILFPTTCEHVLNVLKKCAN